MQVKIRPWKQEDKEPLAAIANNFNIWQNLRDRLPHPYTPEDAEDWINFNKNILPTLNFCIEVDGQVAGSIGLTPQIDVHRNNMEIGYFLGEPFWHKGIATRAVGLLLQYVAEVFPHISRIYAPVFERNKPSMRVLEKNGFHLEAILKRSVIKNNIVLDEYLWVRNV